jgi:hypothetical protein
MDFNKPYEPSPAALEAKPETAGDQPPRRKSAQPIPALFRKKAA